MVTSVATVNVSPRGASVHTCPFAIVAHPSAHSVMFSEKPLASNEWPQSFEGGRELQALFDRFVLRRSVRPIRSAAGRQRLLWTRDHTPKLSTSITPGEIDQAHHEALSLPWTEEARQALEVILRFNQRGDRLLSNSINVGTGC